MSAAQSLLFFDGGQNEPLALLREFAASHSLDLVSLATPEEMFVRANRGFPACMFLDVRGDGSAALAICERIKKDPFLAIIPVALFVGSGSDDLATRGLEAGADEVLHEKLSDHEKPVRLDVLLRRATRDVSVHPTTRLPGTNQIERDIARRMADGGRFALCYADVDHFKEFNDRYGYNRGDRVILLLSMILRDVVRSLAPGGFLGHIGGDDFIFSVPLEHMEKTCDEVLALFDELIPFQYHEEDRKAGYYLGKDRRGNLLRIPLMTLSIGVVTNQFQEFAHPAQASELCAEMKTYAKTLLGSVYVVDRRQIEAAEAPAKV